MKILKFKKQSKDKYKLYLDNNSDITLYEDVIIKNNLLITKEISDELYLTPRYVRRVVQKYYKGDK